MNPTGYSRFTVTGIIKGFLGIFSGKMVLARIFFLWGGGGGGGGELILVGNF